MEKNEGEECLKSVSNYWAGGLKGCWAGGLLGLLRIFKTDYLLLIADN